MSGRSLYVYDKSMPVEDVPTDVEVVFVTAERFEVRWEDGMWIRWSDAEVCEMAYIGAAFSDA